MAHVFRSISRQLLHSRCKPPLHQFVSGTSTSKQEMDKLDISHRETVLATLGTKSEMVNANLSRTSIPALSIESFGNLSETMLPWSLMKLFDSAYMLDVWPIYDGVYQRDKAMIYSLGCRIDVDPSFYQLDTLKFPLVIDNSVIYVKNTSRRIQYTLRHPDSKTPYAVKSDIDVNVDPQTRRPTPFPSWWKDRFNFPSDGPKLEYITPEKPSSGIVTSSQRVHYSDLDENWHVNYTAYVKYCYDAFAENAHLKKYGRDVVNLLQNGVKSFQIQFLNESLLGDMLTVDSWQDAQDENTFHFEVKKGSELSIRLTYAFFDNKLNIQTLGNKL